MEFPRTLAGLRVVDLSENIAGPLACMVLGDLGADVVKVERPGTGEATRGLPPRWGDADGESTVFLGFNRNKRSLALDIRSEAGREAVLRLGARSDIVVASFRPGVSERLGLDYDAFAAVNDRIVHCSVSAFGTGPLGSERAGYDALLQAFTGIMEMTGEPDGGPCRAAPSIIDTSTGMWSALAILAALLRRDAGAGAQRIETALVDSGLFLMCHQIMGLLGTGTFPGRLGSGAPSAAPYQVWPTASRPIMIATSTDRMYRTLCSALGLDELAEDPRFLTTGDRIARRGELADLIGRRLAERDAETWLQELSDAGIPAAPVHDLAAALDDPITKERGLIDTAETGPIANLGQVRLPMDTERQAPLRQPPAVGEHSAEVLRETRLRRGRDPRVGRGLIRCPALEESDAMRR